MRIATTSIIPFPGVGILYAALGHPDSDTPSDSDAHSS